MPKFTQISLKELDDFSKNHPDGNIHQTSMWANFQSNVPGRGKCIACGIKDGDELRSAGLFVRQQLPFGLCWYFAPRGPLLGHDGDLDMIVDGIRSLEPKCVFVRWESAISSQQSAGMETWGRKAHSHYFPEHTIFVDLTESEEEILKQMKQKGRYNIKVARKHGIEVVKSKDVGEFFNVFEETTARDGFSGHNLQYYENMLNSLGNNAQLYLAKYEGSTIAGIIVTFYKDVAIYYFGASSNDHRNLMAPYVLQWEAMRDAKSRECSVYDLFGVAPLVVGSSGGSCSNGVSRCETKAVVDPKHPWAGITRFKSQFGGRRVDYAEAREKVLKPFWYWLIRLRKWMP